jgi:hypothetical protein
MIKTRLLEIWLAGRMLAWLLVLPLLKRLMPLPALVGLMWARPGTSRAFTPAEIDRMWRIGRWLAVRVWPRRAGTCLEQSLVLYRYLSARRASPELVIGVRRHDASVGAHAWVTLNGLAVGDSADALAEFTPLVSFGSGGVPSGTVTLAPHLL